ncbi:hypothetical protein Tco_1211785 [Tanacetum coccineum]
MASTDGFNCELSKNSEQDWLSKDLCPSWQPSKTPSQMEQIVFACNRRKATQGHLTRGHHAVSTIYACSFLEFTSLDLLEVLLPSEAIGSQVQNVNGKFRHDPKIRFAHVFLTASRPDIQFQHKVKVDYAGSHGDRKSTTWWMSISWKRFIITWSVAKSENPLWATSSPKQYVAAATVVVKGT